MGAPLRAVSSGAAVIRQRVIDGLANGCVILLHDGRGTDEHPDASQVVEALPGIIDEARRRGFQFVTLGRLMRGESDR